jgi:hypothetical protein
MKTVSFYHKDTGALHGNMLFVSDDAMLAGNTPKDHIAIDGHHDPLCKKVDLATGKVVDYQPPQPSDDHEWNADTKRWQIKAAITAKARAKAEALRQIVELELSGIRRMRELLLGLVGIDERLSNIDAQMTSLRAQLQE